MLFSRRLLRTHNIFMFCAFLIFNSFNPVFGATYTSKPALTGFSVGAAPGQPGFVSSAGEACQLWNGFNPSLSDPLGVNQGDGLKSCSANGGAINWYNNTGGNSTCTCNRYVIDYYGKYFDMGLVTRGVTARRYCPLNEPTPPVFVSEGIPFESCLYAGGPEIKNKTLSLVVVSPGSKQIRPSGTGGSSVAELLAKVVEGTTPKAGLAVQFSTDSTANSGGHDHSHIARPKAVLTPLSGITDSNGEVRFKFNATPIAGIHTITATCSDCSNKTAVENLTVKVPDLVEMPPDTKVPPRYTLVGQTANHSSNHWFTLSSRNTLYMVVDVMVKTGWGAVGINDGSLIWGGLFDIKGNWSPSHSEHRTGNEVDISVTNPGLVSASKKKNTYAELCKKENTAFSLQTLWHVDDGYPEHFHMYLDGTGLTSQAGGGSCCARYKTTRAKNDTNGNPVLDAAGKPVQETVALCEETSPR
jgi:hypothetical protein